MGILAFLFISSCTIQKRTVNKGWFVQWHWDKKIKSNSSGEENKPVELTETQVTEENEYFETAAVPALEEAPAEQLNQLDSKKDVVESEKGGSISLKQIPAKVNEIRNSSKSLHQKEMRQSPPPMDTELVINIGLLVLFLALAILFTVLALNVSTGVLLYGYWGLAVLCFVQIVRR